MAFWFEEMEHLTQTTINPESNVRRESEAANSVQLGDAGHHIQIQLLHNCIIVDDKNSGEGNGQG